MPRKISTCRTSPKYRQVFETLSHEILSGKYQPRQKFPSEAALVQRSAPRGSPSGARCGS
jgi:DNA-binding GntR family transcriptional regulator